MSDETLEEYIRQLIESHRTPEVTIAWQGGEPTLMRLDFFKKAVEIANKIQKAGTNGTAYVSDKRPAARRRVVRIL